VRDHSHSAPVVCVLESLLIAFAYPHACALTASLASLACFVAFAQNALLLAKTYLRLNQRDEALVWLEHALAIPTKNLDDEEAHKEATQLYKKYQK
jgi:hypothetical protein